jgi:hypothetical protein
MPKFSLKASRRPQLAALAKMIDEAAARGADLTHRLLAFARKQPLQPREVDVNSLIIEATNLLRPTLGAHIEVETTLASVTSRADRSQPTYEHDTQSRAQRPRRNGRTRQAHHRDQQHLPRRELLEHE